jgi:hypothetical protein
VDLQSVLDGTLDSGVPHGALLLEFTDAVLGADEARLVRAREAVRSQLGEERLVDAAGAVASFNAVVKVADGVGLTVDAFRAEQAAGIRTELGIDFHR